MKKKIKFALIGCAGFVAKKHVSVIKKLNGDLIYAMDKHDNVGYLDSFFPDCIFFKSEKDFFKEIKKSKIDYVVICSPNYLHFKHICYALKSNCNVICEKPTVLNFLNLKKIQVLEKKIGKTCYSLFQLRYNQVLIDLKKSIEKIKKQKKILKVQINYFTPRGNWYLSSWKSDEKLSGGLIYNIGVHFFDLISWFFGESKKNTIYFKRKNKIKGRTIFKNAEVSWLLSTELKNNYKKNLSSNRFIKFNSKKINFTKNFNNLHLITYRKIIKGNGVRIIDLLTTFKNIEKLK